MSKEFLSLHVCLFSFTITPNDFVYCPSELELLRKDIGTIEVLQLFLNISCSSCSATAIPALVISY